MKDEAKPGNTFGWLFLVLLGAKGGIHTTG
jgi:hypothetical protein